METTFYVSNSGNNNNSGLSQNESLATISGAIKIIADYSKKIPNTTFRILVDGGYYYLDKPVKVSSKDLNNSELIIKNLNDKAVYISGGRRLFQKWEKVGANVWKTQTKENFKQLFQNTKRLTRARWPNVGSYLQPKNVNAEQKWIQFSDSLRLDFSLNENMELVTTGTWHFIRQRLSKIDTVNYIIETKTEVGPECSSTKVGIQDRIYFENDIDFLDDTNEWFLDKDSDTLFLYSKSDPSNVEFYYPVIENLFYLEGDRSNPLSVSIEGINFTHTTWDYTQEERKGIQAGAWGTAVGKPVYMPEAAIILKYTWNTKIKNCKFINIGDGAIALEEGCHYNVITKNLFKNIGSNVIQVGRITNYIGRGHPLHHDYDHKNLAPSKNIIANNQFLCGAQIDNGGVAIWVGYANHTEIKNNLIENFPYTAISVGWHWDSSGKLTNTHHNIISHNRITNSMTYLSDGGAIYTVGNQSGTVIEHNWISDIGGGAKWIEGIYLDEGSANISILNNYVNDVQDYDLKTHRALLETLTIKDNGCENCTNPWVIQNERVSYSNFRGNYPKDTTIYGILNIKE